MATHVSRWSQQGVHHSVFKPALLQALFSKCLDTTLASLRNCKVYCGNRAFVLCSEYEVRHGTASYGIVRQG